MRRQWMLGGIALCGAVLLMAGLSNGCGKAAETLTEKAIEKSLSEDGQNVDVDLDSDGGTVRIATDEGEMVISGDDDSFSMTSEEGGVTMTAGESAKLPGNFPKDVPLPKGFKPDMVQTADEDNMFTVVGPAEGGVKEVADALRKDAAAQGWTEEQSFSQAGVMEQISCHKPGRMLTIMVMGENGKTMVNLVTADE